MKSAKLFVLLFFVFSFFPNLAKAQNTQTMRLDPSNSLLIQEFQALLTVEGETISVVMRIGRQNAEAGVDRLEQGDIILMMNGKRTKTIEQLRDIYNSLETDSEIKIGVRRGEERFIINAVKEATTENAPQMTMSFDNGTFATGEGENIIIQSMGIILTNSEDGVLVSRVIAPMLAEELKPLNIEGYTIVSFNGKKPASATDLKESIDAIAIGDDVAFIFEKDREEKSITFKKKAPVRTMSINPGNN